MLVKYRYGVIRESYATLEVFEFEVETDTHTIEFNEKLHTLEVTDNKCDTKFNHTVLWSSGVVFFHAHKLLAVTKVTNPLRVPVRDLPNED